MMQLPTGKPDGGNLDNRIGQGGSAALERFHRDKGRAGSTIERRSNHGRNPDYRTVGAHNHSYRTRLLNRQGYRAPKEIAAPEKRKRPLPNLKSCKRVGHPRQRVTALVSMVALRHEYITDEAPERPKQQCSVATSPKILDYQLHPNTSHIHPHMCG